MAIGANTTEVKYYRGDSYSKEFTIIDEETDTPIDISGYTLIMEVDELKTPPDGTTQKFTATGTIVDALNGIVSFTPSSANNDMPEAVYYYRVKMTLGATIRTVIRDKYTII